jgi:hypothetical protein
MDLSFGCARPCTEAAHINNESKDKGFDFPTVRHSDDGQTVTVRTTSPIYQAARLATKEALVWAG